MTVFILLLILLVYREGFCLYNDDRPARGEMFYEFPVPEKKQPERQQAKEEPKKETRKEQQNTVQPEKKEPYEFPVRPDAPPVLAKFLKEPTEENAKEFLRWQSWYFNHLSKVSYALKSAYMKYGEEVYNVTGYPRTVQFADDYNNAYKERFYRSIFAKHRDNLGLLFFYSSGCPYCHRMISVINYLADTYGVEIRGVSSDAVVPASFRSYVSPQTFAKYGIRSVPAVVAVYTKDGKIYQDIVASGFTPLDDLIGNILSFMVYHGIIQPKELNPNYQFKGVIR